MKNYLIVILALCCSTAFSKTLELQGSLSENQLISSEVLGYDLWYRVYKPPNYDELSDVPVIYLTDGQWYIQSGRMHEEIDFLISQGKIKPIVAVFVDNRDPHNLTDNRRVKQFLGYDNYVEFYKKELVPQVEADYKVSTRQLDRAIMGLSFGGLNATYFGAKASDIFHMLGIQSPALHPVPDIYRYYEMRKPLPVKIFLSTGSTNDTEVHARRLKESLELKKYEFKYIEVDEGHNWRNWQPLLDDALIYFFGT